MNNEVILLGLPTQATSNPARAAEIVNEILSSDSTFSHAGEPSNAIKMKHIREVFENEEAGMHDPFPLMQVFNCKEPGRHQSGMFLCDLRCQYIRRCIDERIIPELMGRILYLKNRIWYVRFREQLALYLLVQERSQIGIEANA